MGLGELLWDCFPDTRRAGDAFTAAAIYGKLNELDLPATAALANRVAALVASHQGAMPDVADAVQAILANLRM